MEELVAFLRDDIASAFAAEAYEREVDPGATTDGGSRICCCWMHKESGSTGVWHHCYGVWSECGSNSCGFWSCRKSNMKR